MLEKLGKTNVFSRISILTVNERENLVDELVKAAGELSATQTGALISLEQSHSLSDYIKTGTKMNSIVTSELLCSIFVPGTPLHDGAVIIQGDKIAVPVLIFRLQPLIFHLHTEPVTARQLVSVKLLILFQSWFQRKPVRFRLRRAASCM